MHLLFLDESGQLAERHFFALGGIALRDADWPLLRELWQETLAAQRWPADREVKWHGIRTGEVPPALADAVVATLARAPSPATWRSSTSSSACGRRPSSSPPMRTPTRPG